jgi:flagella synthesis protein FlgN
MMAAVSPKNSLQAELSKITELLDVLKREQQDLVAADIDHLTSLTPQKSALVSEMAALATTRHNALAEAGFPAMEAGMESWLAAQQDDAANLLWQRLLDQTREAKELNRLNGVLINKHLGHTQGALQALRPQQTTVYGPSGMTTSGGTRRGFIAG